MRKYFLAAAFILAAFVQSFAQNIGHANSAEIMSAMPETKVAEATLKALNTQLSKSLEARTKAFQIAYQDYMTKAQAGQSDPNVEKGLETQYKALQKQEADAQKSLEKKRNELYGPITKKFDTAVQFVGKAMGLNYILDESLGGFLPGPGAKDVNAEVKRALGL